MTKIIYPPRPKGAVPPTDLPHYDELGLFCIQPKYNGSRSIIHIAEDRRVQIFSRHGRAHHSYTMPLPIQNEILALPGLPKATEIWLDGELMVKTTPEDTKGKIILFDVLHYKEYLFLQYTQVERLNLLAKICGEPTKLDPWRGMGYQISDNLLMAPTFFSNFKDEFLKDYGDEVEGLVLRKKDSLIDNFGQKEYEVPWLIRCRRPHKNYHF
jgi:ATP-dependent DNA ligase